MQDYNSLCAEVVVASAAGKGKREGKEKRRDKGEKGCDGWERRRSPKQKFTTPLCRGYDLCHFG